MYGCAIGLKLVRDMDNNFIAPACFNKRARIRTIENFAKRLEITIRSNLGSSAYILCTSRRCLYLHIAHFEPILF